MGSTLTMNYDGLRRLSSVTGGTYTRSYTYRDISSTKTTLQVSQLAYSGLGSSLSFNYTYDSLGNIATYAATGKGTVTYTYDNQGQLTKAAGYPFIAAPWWHFQENRNIFLVFSELEKRKHCLGSFRNSVPDGAGDSAYIIWLL